MTDIKYIKIILGELGTNCYLVWEEKTKKALVIDPADDGVGISEEIQARGLDLVGILATHGHFDHVMGALDLKLIYQSPFYCSQKDLFLLQRQQKTASHFLGRKIKVPNFSKIDIDLDMVDKISLGDISVEVIKTPGHTPGGVCFYIKEAGLLFGGDTIFAHSRGRTDLSYSSTKDIYQSIKTIMKLPEETIILPGHGEETTVGREKDFYLKD